MDYVLIDADQALFEPTFGAAMVVVRPGMLRGSGPASLNGKRLCVVGDEASATVKGCLYSSGTYPIPGVGSLEVASLGSNQRTRTIQSGGQQLLLVGGSFTARFRVESPAQQPTAAGAPIPDPMATYTGKGRFLTTNRILRAH
jgi:hypothetical protein